MSGRSARRVLHVFGAMDRGGAETRTMEIMRRTDREVVRFDFCVLSGRPGVYAPEIERLGGRVLACPLTRRPYGFPMRFTKLLRDGGYDVVHSHVHQFSGATLILARLAGVATRIAHLRSCDDGRSSGRRRRAYRRLMRALIDRNATHVLGVSAAALEAFWGSGWEHDARRQVIYNGVEPGPPLPPAARRALRSELGVPANARLVMHVGNFVPAKNHEALIAIAGASRDHHADLVFVLVGDGPLRPAIEQAVTANGLAPRIRFLGRRDDVPRLLRAADALAHPSRWEGLPGAVLEAVAAHLPVVASSIPPIREIARHTTAVTLSDASDPPAFARAITGAIARREHDGRKAADGLPPMFHIETATERLLACYR